MLIAITVISILAISALVWIANRVFSFAVCPMCAGVFLTWMGLVGAHFLGYQIDLVVPALLIGGSVVGIAYQLEKKFAKPSLLWKALFVPSGFIVAYSILQQMWTVVVLTGIFLVLLSLAFVSSRDTAVSRGESAGSLEKKMKDCC